MVFMKKYLFLILTFFILFDSCQKDDLSWMAEIESIKAEISNQKKLIEALQTNANISGIESNGDSYTIRFSNGQTITLSNGKSPVITIGDNGNWYINGEDTGMESRGSDGKTPKIEIRDGYWWIDGSNTGVIASGINGTNAPIITNIVLESSVLTFYFSDKTQISCKVVINYDDKIKEMDNKIDAMVDSRFDDYCSIFSSVIHIGDSVTEGHIYDYPMTPSGKGKVMREFSYPTFLGRMVGWDYENAGVSGISAEGWWRTRFSKYDFKQYQLAIIELGYNGTLENTIDSDVKMKSDFTTYSDDNCSRYCSIIEGLQAQRPNMFIVLVISALFNDTKAATTKAIGEYYNLPVIDLRDKSYINLNDPLYHGFTNEYSRNSVHFNAIGYYAKAKVIRRQLGKIIAENMDKVDKSLYML